MYELRVYDTQNQAVGILQNISSIQWQENYHTPGEVKIEARPTPGVLAMARQGYRLYNHETGTAARIVSTEIREDVNADTISIRAVLAGQLLDERVVMATQTVRNVEQGIYAIYTANRRGLPFGTAPLKGLAETTDTEVSWGSVLQAVSTLAEAAGLGVRVLYAPETGVETLEVYKGVDRTDGAGADYVGYFGDDIGNIQSAVIQSAAEEFRNVAVVAGEEKDSAPRAVKIVSLQAVQGEARKELYVDAGNVRTTYRKARDTGRVDSKGNPVYEYDTITYTAAEYVALLEAKGLEELAKHMLEFTVRCEIEQGSLQYGKDYGLGDRLPMKMSKYGLAFSARVSSVKIVYESSGRSVVASLTDFRMEE